MKLSSIIFEGFREDVSIVNGEKYSVDWLGNADTLQDFQDALKRMPETIEYINVPTDDKLFNPSAKRIKPKGSWKLEVYATVKKVIDMHEKEGNELADSILDTGGSLGTSWLTACQGEVKDMHRIGKLQLLYVLFRRTTEAT